ncbi:3'-5' exonuclease [Streptomyces sp. WAC 00631]|uniref:exonuclease domain-containing protein n=1 Tax=Streptomyces sp. WAC 00631 TaxID=2203201 RepID=UPI000F7B9D4A|nr:exonuclease domain-containing protein [Streptomyces sp. WAC 00631]MCC5036129.1 3'-5' exonuclease [Streptomyces sp. WAC 00631]
MGWHREALIGFDLETTGTDIETDRIVTAALAELAPDGRAGSVRTWLLDPGIPVPGEAAAIHGITTERAVRDGLPAAAGVAEIVAAVAEVLRSGRPLAVMNARYDLSLLDRECRRHGIAPLAARLGREPGPVIDPLVLDKHVDRYRKGKRTLQALCEHYDIPLTGAHDAGADAFAAAGVAACIGRRHASVGSLEPAALHDLQIRAAADQAASFQRYLRRTSDPRAYVERAWPLIPAQRERVGGPVPGGGAEAGGAGG